MRDRDDRAVERAHQLLHPLARLDIEVRLRLVEQQHVGVAQQAGGEPDELPLAAREHARRLREVVVLETDVDEQRACAAVEARAARGGPALEQPLLALEQLRQLVEVVARLAERALDGRELLLELVEVGARRPQRLERMTLVAFELLRQERHRQPAALRYFSRVRDSPRRRGSEAASTSRRRSARSRPCGRRARCRSRARRGSAASRSSSRSRVPAGET